MDQFNDSSPPHCKISNMRTMAYTPPQQITPDVTLRMPPRRPPRGDNYLGEQPRYPPSQKLIKMGIQEAPSPPHRPLPSTPKALPQLPASKRGFGQTPLKKQPRRVASSLERKERGRADYKGDQSAPRSSSAQNSVPRRLVGGVRAPPSTPDGPGLRRSSEALRERDNMSPMDLRMQKSMKGAPMYSRARQNPNAGGAFGEQEVKLVRSYDSLGYVSADSEALTDDEDIWVDDRSDHSFVSALSRENPGTKHSDNARGVKENIRQKPHEYNPEHWVRPRYISGRIITEPTFGLYAIPAMTALDVLCQTVPITDEMVIDSIVDYFASYGFGPVGSEMDRFWTKEYNFAQQQQSRKFSDKSPVMEVMPSPMSLPTTPPTPSKSYFTFKDRERDRNPTTPMSMDSHASNASSAWSDSSSSKSGTPSTGGGSGKRFSSALSFLRGGGNHSHQNNASSASMADGNYSQTEKGSIRSFLSFDPSSRNKEKRTSQESKTSTDTGGSGNQALKRPPAASVKSSSSVGGGQRTMSRAGSPRSGRDGDWSPLHSSFPSAQSQHSPVTRSFFKIGTPGTVSGNRRNRNSESDSITSSEKDREEKKKISLKKLAAKVDLSGSGAYDLYG